MLRDYLTSGSQVLHRLPFYSSFAEDAPPPEATHRFPSPPPDEAFSPFPVPVLSTLSLFFFSVSFAPSERTLSGTADLWHFVVCNADRAGRVIAASNLRQRHGYPQAQAASVPSQFRICARGTEHDAAPNLAQPRSPWNFLGRRTLLLCQSARSRLLKAILFL